MEDLRQHPWYILTQSINKKFQEEDQDKTKKMSCFRRFATDVKCLYVYMRYRKDRLDYKQRLKDAQNE